MNGEKNLLLALGIAGGLLLVCLFSLVLGWFFIVQPAIDRTFNEITGFPCLILFTDQNANGQYDPGDPVMSNPPAGIEVTVYDPDGKNGGRFPLSECYLSGAGQRRQVVLTVILPPGYTATTPLRQAVMVEESTYFIDNPPRVYFGVQTSPTP